MRSPRSFSHPARRQRALAGRRARGGRPRGFFLILLTLGLLMAQGNRVLHDLLVAHSVCEHGALTHDEAPHRAIAAPASPGADTEIAPARGAPREHGATHEHCDAKSVLHRIGELGVAIAPASLLSIDPPASSGEAWAFAPIALLDLAPKSSPPTT